MREGIRRYKERSVRGAVAGGIGGTALLLILIIKLTETCNQVKELNQQINKDSRPAKKDTLQNYIIK